jgi:hypothetical protein
VKESRPTPSTRAARNRRRRRPRQTKAGRREREATGLLVLSDEM